MYKKRIKYKHSWFLKNTIAIKIYVIGSIYHDLIIYTPLDGPSKVIGKKYFNLITKACFQNE
jgi:hypothetical protein